MRLSSRTLGLALLAVLAAACSSNGGQGGASTSHIGGGDARFFLPTDTPTNTSAPSVEVDAAGGVHAVYPRYAGGGAFYAYCAAGCASSQQVKVVPFETQGSVANAMIALDAEGRPRVLLASAAAVVFAAPHAGADFTDPTAWSKVEVVRHDGARQVTGEAFALDRAGRPRFLMHTYKAYLDVGQKPPATYWVACDADDCASSLSAWTTSKIADEMWRSADLRYDANGVAKVGAAITVDRTPSSSGVLKAAYAECASACDTPEGWKGIALLQAYENDLEAVSVPPAVSLALTKAGAPRIAFLGVTEYGKKNVTYFECEDGCSEDAWRGNVLSDSPELGAGLDLVLDANDRPRFAFTQSYSIALATCDAADCTATLSPWTFAVVEDSSSMKPDQIFLYDNCTVGAWYLHSPSLALTNDGRPRVGYQARDISGGFGNKDPNRLKDCVAGTDMTWSRLAILP